MLTRTMLLLSLLCTFGIMIAHAETVPGTRHTHDAIGTSDKGGTCESFPFVDDGVSEEGYELGSLTSTFVQRFTPPSYPFRYTGVCVCFFATTEVSSLNIDLVAFAADCQADRLEIRKKRNSFKKPLHGQ